MKFFLVCSRFVFSFKAIFTFNEEHDLNKHIIISFWELYRISSCTYCHLCDALLFEYRESMGTWVCASISHSRTRCVCVFVSVSHFALVELLYSELKYLERRRLKNKNLKFSINCLGRARASTMRMQYIERSRVRSTAVICQLTFGWIEHVHERISAVSTEHHSMEKQNT